MDPFIGEIRMFAGNFAPTGWALCNGQLIPISQNTALFSLLGTMYGGDGATTFALPNLQARVPIQAGTGPGLTPRTQGEAGGSTTVTLTTNQIPAHNHNVMADTAAGVTQDPTDATWGTSGRGRPVPYGTTPNTAMSPAALSSTGGSQPHNNMQPYISVTFIIALQGVYPPRS